MMIDHDEPTCTCPERLSRTLARTAKGGAVVIEAVAIHTHACPAWRTGTRHGPCRCGAEAEWQRLHVQLSEEITKVHRLYAD